MAAGEGRLEACRTEAGPEKSVLEEDVSEDRIDPPEGPRSRRRRPEPTPMQRALGLLVRREHSQKELTRKLTTRGIEAGDAQAAVTKLREAGWQDDTRFAESLARSRAAAGYGPVRIRAELGMHGLGREAISRVLEDFDGGWAEKARDLVRRRFGPAVADDLDLQRKAVDFLIRRGFDTASVRAATHYSPDD